MQVEKFRLYETAKQQIIDANAGWTTIDTGDYPYHGPGYNWADLLEDRESVMIKNQDVDGLIYFSNFVAIDSEDEASLEYNSTESRWELTVPVVADAKFELLDTGVLRDAVNTDSPIIMYTGKMDILDKEVKFTGTPVELSVASPNGVAVYSVELEDDDGWPTSRSIPVDLRLFDTPTPVDADAMTLAAGAAVSLEASHELIFNVKTSEAMHHLQVK